MKRRRFLELSASASVLALINAHTTLAAAAASSNKHPASETSRIIALRLLTTTPLEIMKKFYNGLMGMPVTEKKGELIVFAGESTITFVHIEENNKRPFYHFAFNIPENKIQEAFEWQRKKTPIIHPNPSGQKDQIVNFAHWNAHSIFFLDPAGNLLEYIARHDLSNASKEAFTSKDILYVSEIGLIVDDVISSGNSLQKETGIKQYKDATPGFWPIGDETGLLLMITKGRIWAGHEGQVNETGVFKTSVTIRTSEKAIWALPGYPYEINTTIKSG